MNKHMQKALFTALALVGLGTWGSRAYAADPIDATITVTPVATVNLALTVTTYAFGSLDVNTSSITASSITLRNVGNVDVTVNKEILTQSSPAGWTAATAAQSGVVALNRYALYVATSAVRPVSGDFTVADHLFDGALSYNSLKGSGGGTPTVTTSGGALNEVYLWFRLDMPSQVTNQTTREITMRFDGVPVP